MGTVTSIAATERPRAIGIHGALEQHERARQALTESLTGAGNEGAATALLDLSERSLPLYTPDQPDPRGAIVVRRHVSWADAVLLATSARHGSYSTQLKTALEYCGPDEFDGTPVGLLDVANGQGPTTALEHLQTVCTTLDAQVLPQQISLSIGSSGEHDELSTECVTDCRVLGQQLVDRIADV